MVEIKMPEAGFNITEGKVVRWYKKAGETLEAGENVVSVETDKITVDVPAEISGVLKEIRCAEGEVAPVGGVLGIIDKTGEADAASSITEDVKKAERPEGTPSVESPIPVTAKAGKGGGRRISPAAKAAARSLGIDLSSIPSGTGPAGRIVKADVEAYAVLTPAASDRVEEKFPADRRVEFEGWRKTLADRVTICVQQVPQCTIISDVDVTALSTMVKALRERESGPKVSYLPFLMKAMVSGIDAVPEMSAHCDGKGFTVKRDINVGLVVNVDGKLILPVVKNVREKSVMDIAAETSALIVRAREGTLQPKDVEGGTITLTNVGPFGVNYGTALIFQPQTAIVCIGAARDMPVVYEGRVEIRKMMGFSVTYDHRVLDGAMCGIFLKEVGRVILDLTMLVT